MKRRLIAKNRIPHGGGFGLKRPDLGMVGYGQTFESLIGSVQSYRKANAIPIGLGFEDELEAVVCSERPNECTPEIPPDIPVSTRITWADIVHGSTLMIKHALNGFKKVSQEEANRRAAICSKCPIKVVGIMPCSICNEWGKLTAALIGSGNTPYGSEINEKACSICHCSLSSSVWVPLELQQSVLTEKQKDQFRTMGREQGCWKAESL